MVIDASLLRSLIQGGMGLNISGHTLTRRVSAHSSNQALGTVSVTGIERTLAWGLQLGDREGVLEEAFSHFPLPKLARRVWQKYFNKAPNKGKALCSVPRWTLSCDRELEELTILAGFCEVFIAKRHNTLPIAVNYLYKVQMPMMATLFGAMLAGVDMVVIGAGIPKDVPHILDRLALCQDVELNVAAHSHSAQDTFIKAFKPSQYLEGQRLELSRPAFVAIVSLHTLAEYLVLKQSVPPDGLIIEHHSAGGHNAPPRDSSGYSQRDEPDLQRIANLGVPVWLAGSRGTPSSIIEAQNMGFVGVQVGTPFALCRESGMTSSLKMKAKEMAVEGTLCVETMALSPTRFPFKVANIPGTVYDQGVYDVRPRICEMGALVEPIADAHGNVHYLCSAEPVDSYVAKGGNREDTIGKSCLCCNLFATAGLAQCYKEVVEPPIVTLGDISQLPDIISRYGLDYSAHDVCDFLLGPSD